MSYFNRKTCDESYAAESRFRLCKADAAVRFNLDRNAWYISHENRRFNPVQRKQFNNIRYVLMHCNRPYKIRFERSVLESWHENSLQFASALSLRMYAPEGICAKNTGKKPFQLPDAPVAKPEMMSITKENFNFVIHSTPYGYWLIQKGRRLGSLASPVRRASVETHQDDLLLQKQLYEPCLACMES